MNGKRMSLELIGILGVGATLLAAVLTAAIGLGMMILSGQRDTAERFETIDTQLESLDSRLRTVEQVQAQHSVLLQLLAQRLGLDADLPQPAEARSETSPGSSGYAR